MINSEVKMEKLRKNGHRHGGGWKKESKRKDPGDYLKNVYIGVKVKYHVEAIREFMAIAKQKYR